jgi:hypothetical protein
MKRSRLNRAGKVVVRLSEREASELLGHAASSRVGATSPSEKRFYVCLENKVRKAWKKVGG